MSALVNAPPYRDVTQKWRNLAERRRAYFVELYQSGRWKHYYSEEQFLLRMREVIYAAEAWSELANAAEHPAPAD